MKAKLEIYLSDDQWAGAYPIPSEQAGALDEGQSWIRVMLKCGSEITVTESFAEHCIELIRFQRARDQEKRASKGVENGSEEGKKSP
jgi:hypothetical protein